MKQFAFVFVWLISEMRCQNLQVSVFYEALCPGSINFITQQLYPNYRRFERYLELELVPYGFTTCDHESNPVGFKCQHGPTECFYNKVQATVLATNPAACSLEFINCMMRAEERCNATLKNCAFMSRVSWARVEENLACGKADEFLLENELKTNSIQPEITYLPTIIFNGIYSKVLQEEAESNFKKVVCSLLSNMPSCCKFQSAFDIK